MTGNALLSAGWEPFDLLGIGVVLCTASGQCVFANRAARKILAHREGLELSSNGVLRITHAPREPLRNALQQASEKRSSGDPGNHDSSFVVRRTDGKWLLKVMVHSVERISVTEEAPHPTAMVLMFDLQSPVSMTDEDLHQLYGFTSAESRLANLLCEGNTLRECCQKLLICDATARTHLKRLFKKTRTRRQCELVSLLLKSLGLARSGEEKVSMQAGAPISSAQEIFFEQIVRTAGQPGRLGLPEIVDSQIS
jgi:DNA-binding CsgD family transcriptional regulator